MVQELNRAIYEARRKGKYLMIHDSRTPTAGLMLVGAKSDGEYIVVKSTEGQWHRISEETRFFVA